MNINNFLINVTIFFFIIMMLYNYFNKFKCYECFKCNINKSKNESKCFDITQKENTKLIQEIKKNSEKLEGNINKTGKTFNKYDKDIKKNTKDAERVAALTDD